MCARTNHSLSLELAEGSASNHPRSMAPSRKVLMLCGDYMEDYEAAVPFYALAALGVAVDCVAPGKRPGDACATAVHDYLGFELYTELPGHARFPVTADFAEAAADPAARWSSQATGSRSSSPRRTTAARRSPW
jgi:hypothetical protein